MYIYVDIRKVICFVYIFRDIERTLYVYNVFCEICWMLVDVSDSLVFFYRFFCVKYVVLFCN